MFHGDCLPRVLVIKYFEKCAVMDEYAPLKSSIRSYSTFLYMGLLHNVHCLLMSQRSMARVEWVKLLLVESLEILSV